MKGGNGQDDEEFEMLLGEIPNATSAANLHVEDFGVISPSTSLVSGTLSDKTMGKTSHSDVLTDYYHPSQPSKNGAPSVSDISVPVSPVTCSSFPSVYGGLSLNRDSFTSSPTKNRYNQNPHNEENWDAANSPDKKEYKKPVESVDEEANCLSIVSKLPDDRSLTSAFSSLSFKSEMSVGPTTDSSGLSKSLPNSGLLMESQYSNHMRRVQCGLEGIGGVLPPSANTINSINFRNAAFDPREMVNISGLTFPSLMNMMNVQENSGLLNLNIHDVGKHKLGHLLPVEVANTLRERRQSLPVYSGPVQLQTGIHSLQARPSVPISGVEFPSAYQQQYFLHLQGSPFLQAQQCEHPNASIQQLDQARIAWQHMDEERHRAAQRHHAHLQLQIQGIRTPNQMRLSSDGPIESLSRNSSLPYYELPGSHVEQPNLALCWNNNVHPQGFNPPNQIPMKGYLCPYSAQGNCERGESCQFAHGQNPILGTGLMCLSNSLPVKDFQGVEVLEKGANQFFPEKLLTRSHGLSSLSNLKPSSNLAYDTAVSLSNGKDLADCHCHPHPSVPDAGLSVLDCHNSGGSSPDKLERLTPRSRQHLKCASLDEIEGKIYTFAKDQHGCRFLQEKFIEGTAEDVQKIFVEVIGHVVDLMTDPFGNYLVQKLLDVCNEDQRMQMLHAITGTAGILVNICLNMHGTRAVQKVIETLKTPEQIAMVVSSLKDGVVSLIKDVNGNHVVQRCLHCLGNEYNKFLFDAAATHCIEIATHRHGCCVLQKCLHHSDGEQRRRLVSEVVANALVLAQDPFGNYVVQYVIELGLPWATAHVVNQLEGHYAHLSSQKYSSNVVEKCLKLAEEKNRALIIQELIDDPCLAQLLQDPFANYVVQSALASSKGPIHSAFVDAIKPHLPALRSNPYGKRILSCTNLKSK